MAWPSFCEIRVGWKRRRARPCGSARPELILVCVLEGEGPQHLDPLAAGEDEEGRGGGHGGDVVAVDEGRCLRPIEMAEVQAVVCCDDHIGNVRMGVEERKAFSSRRSGWSDRCSRRGRTRSGQADSVGDPYRADGGIEF
jgi:hypothetical protein